jgi:hypothetical protein
VNNLQKGLGVETSWVPGVASIQTSYLQKLPGVGTPFDLRKRNATPLRLGQHNARSRNP